MAIARTPRWRAATMPARAIIRRNPLVRFQHGFEMRFEKVRSAYHGYLTFAMERRVWFAAGFIGFRACCRFCWCRSWARISSPRWTRARFHLHVRAPMGTRIEETAALFDHIENRIRQVIPPDQLGSIVDNIDLPVSGTNRAYINTGSVGPEDGDILISLNENHTPHRRLCEDASHGAAAKLSRVRPFPSFRPISSARF